jgi:type IV pilus assembly protein PilQ
MKAAYPYKRCMKALKIVSMIVVLWGVGYHVNGHLACDHLFQDRPVYAQEVAEAPALIKAIEVSEVEKDSLVTIKASKPVTYTVVKLQDPFRILVDIPQFATEQVIETIPVKSAVINEITNEQMEKGERSFCRIAIVLNQDVEYDVSTQASDLLIRIAEPAEKEDESPGVEENSARAPEPADEESNIIALRINDDGDGMTVISDSAIASYKSFQMDNPYRLVLDIPDVQDRLSKKTFTFQSSLIDKIKVGQHPEKVRLVIYFKDTLPTYSIDKEENKLFVAWAVPNGEEENGMRAIVRGEDQMAVAAAEPAPGEEEEEEKVYTGQKISLDFKDADVRNILRLISDISGLNIIVSDNVKGKVTIKLDDVPWDEVLDIILETNNLGKIWSKSVMRIETQEQIRRISDDKYKAQKSREKVEELQTEVIDIIYRDAQDVVDLLGEEKELSSERGIISVDPNLNRLVLTDTADKIAAIKQRIARYDDRTVRQVFIEAKIVQSIPTHTKEIGIQWGGPYATGHNDGVIGVAGASGVEFNREEVTDPVTGLVTEVVEVMGGNVIDLPAAVGLGAGGGIGFGYLKDNLELTATLTALEKDEKLKIVSSPRVLSIDKNEALIKQGVALPYLKLSEEGVTSTEFKDAVLELKVIPTILSEKIIKIELKVKKDQKSAQTGAGGEPGIDVREAHTVLMVESGRTVVIGGIYEETTNTIMSGVPFFSDIPGIGRLFRNDFSKKELTELLIFVTTTIVPRDIIGGES